MNMGLFTEEDIIRMIENDEFSLLNREGGTAGIIHSASGVILVESKEIAVCISELNEEFVANVIKFDEIGKLIATFEKMMVQNPLFTNKGEIERLKELQNQYPTDINAFHQSVIHKIAHLHRFVIMDVLNQTASLQLA